jgi:hypothetical protein
VQLLRFGLMRRAEAEVWLYGSMEAAVAGAGPPALPPGAAPQCETINRFWIRILGSAVAGLRLDAGGRGGGVAVWLHGGGCGGRGTAGFASWHRHTR